MIIEIIDNNNLVYVQNWWNNLTIEDRLLFLNENGWQDLKWSEYKLEDLPSPVLYFIESVYNKKNDKI